MVLQRLGIGVTLSKLVIGENGKLEGPLNTLDSES